jgi:hypothetical protein
VRHSRMMVGPIRLVRRPSTVAMLSVDTACYET